MDYPHDFPAESRAKVEAAKIRAGRRFDSSRAKARWNSEIRALFWTYVLTPFLVFAEESARLVLWPADKMDQHCREFLRLLTIDAYYQKGKVAGLSEMISNWNGSILWEAQQEIEKTSQWRKYENILLKFSTRGRSATQETGVTLQMPDSKATDNKAKVEAYIEEVYKKTGRRITKTDFWKAAGYKTRTEFERWERGDSKRRNKSAERNFNLILQEKPHLK
jgi:hypothetical protein